MEINYFAVLVAGISGMALGMAWYGPLFGKIWIKLMGFTQADIKKAQEKGMGKTIALGFLSQLVMAYVLAYFIIGWATSDATMTGLSIGLQSGFWLWLGLVATVQLHQVLWEGKSWKYYVLTTGYWLAVTLVMGAILGSWR